MTWRSTEHIRCLFLTVFCIYCIGCSETADTGLNPISQIDVSVLDMGLDAATLPSLETIEYVSASAPVPKLTREQITRSLKDIFGAEIVVTGLADPDPSVSGFITIGAGVSTISPRGVEGIEGMAYRVAALALSDTRRAMTVGCDVTDRVCITSVLRKYSRLLWRRALTDDEFSRLDQIYSVAADRLTDPSAGLEFAFAYLIQSPHFLFRKELGQDGGFTALDLASRLSFLLWNTSPDDILLTAAESGSLATEQGLRDTIGRLLDDPRARTGFLRFFTEWFGLAELDSLNKDPGVFPSLSADLGQRARQETLLGLEALVFDEDGDFRDFLTTRRTFVDRKLAALYGIRAPLREGFGEVEMPVETGRRGFLGQASFLLLNSHPVSTSATLRGKFVRERMLCHVVPPPPADVDTSIPEPSGRRQTLRERVTEHLQNESCSACHLITDPIGLAFERFDGLAVRRTLDNGGVIDPSGDLDGEPFNTAAELTVLLRQHRDLARCITVHLHRFVTGVLEGVEHNDMIDAVTDRFEAQGFRIKELLTEVLLSRIFRGVSVPEEAAQ